MHLREVFQQALREIGWVEGQNITFEYRWSEGRDDRLPDLAAELVINLKTAKALGLTFPQSILIRADEVIQ